MGEENGPVFCKVCVFDVSRVVGIARFESLSDPQLLRNSKRHLPKGRSWILLEFHLNFRNFTRISLEFYSSTGALWKGALRALPKLHCTMQCHLDNTQFFFFGGGVVLFGWGLWFGFWKVLGVPPHLRSGPKKPWQPQTWQDLTRFSPLDFSLLSPDFRGLVLLNCTSILEKKQKIQWRASSGDGAPKLQISAPCRGRTCPEPNPSFFGGFSFDFSFVCFFWREGRGLLL